MLKIYVLMALKQQNDRLMAQGGVESTAEHADEIAFPGERELPRWSARRNADKYSPGSMHVPGRDTVLSLQDDLTVC